VRQTKNLSRKKAKNFYPNPCYNSDRDNTKKEKGKWQTKNTKGTAP